MMKLQDKKEFYALLSAMAELYNRTLSEVHLILYWEVLNQFDLEKIKDAAKHILQDRKYASFPLPAEFIEFIQPKHNLDAQAEFALAEFRDRLMNHLVCFWFQDPYLCEVVRLMGGWLKICEDYNQLEDITDRRFWEADVRKLYQAVVGQGTIPEQKQILGRHAVHNLAAGYLLDRQGENIWGEEGWIKADTEEGRKYIADHRDNVMARFLPQPDIKQLVKATGWAGGARAQNSRTGFENPDV